MFKYVTAETVSPGHPDKIADLISDYVLTKALENNPSSRVAVETVLTGTKDGGLVMVGGEISEIANISTDVGDVECLIKDKKFLVKPENNLELASALLNVLIPPYLSLELVGHQGSGFPYL